MWRRSSTPPFKAGEITAPAELEAMIIALRGRADALSQQLPRADELKGLVAFIDPIDGTKEFCTGLGEQCSICVGFADRASGLAVGGIVYRPLCPHQSWALGSKPLGLADGALRRHDAPPGGAFLASNGGTSPFLDALRAELGCSARPQGGAGNKALRVLEEQPRGVYIQDRGVSRCAHERRAGRRARARARASPQQSHVCVGHAAPTATLRTGAVRAGGTHARRRR